MSIDLSVLIGLDILSVIILAIILIACFMDRKTKEARSKFFIAMLSFEILFIGLSAFHYDMVRTIINTASMRLERQCIITRGLSNVAFFLLLISFTLYVSECISVDSLAERWIKRSVVLVCAVYAAGCAATVFVPSFARVFYYIDTSGSHYSHMFVVAQIGSYYLVATMLFLLVKHRKSLGANNFWALISFIACPMLVSVTRFFGEDIYLMAPATFVSFILMYCFMYLQNSEKLHKQELLLANNRLDVLQSQIRPHFLYNTLNSIYVLCGKDPSAAQSAIADFSEYMRANLESLEENDLISLDRELDHVDHYLNLEKMRFSGDLEVVYDTDYTDIMIPPMTVQILAENAVKHGIEKRENGFGRVVIRSRRTANSDLVIVEDNGVGFDVARYDEDPGSHVGLANVKERLKHLLGATLLIESEMGKGTTVSIIIPRANKRTAEKAE